MFSTIAAPRPRDRAQQAGSLALALLLNGGLVATAILLGGRVAEQQIEQKPEGELVFIQPEAPHAAASAAPAPAPHRRPTVVPKPQQASPPTPQKADDVGSTQAPASTSSTEPSKDDGGGAGATDPSSTGSGDPKGAGPPPSTPLEIRSQVQPVYPKSALYLGLDRQRCEAHFVVDAKGKPESVVVDGCPDAFQDSVRDAASRWTFYPRKENGAPVEAAFTLSVTFVAH